MPAHACVLSNLQSDNEVLPATTRTTLHHSVLSVVLQLLLVAFGRGPLANKQLSPAQQLALLLLPLNPAPAGGQNPLNRAMCNMGDSQIRCSCCSSATCL